MDFEDEDIDVYDDGFRSEVKAFERAGPSGKLIELLSSPSVLEDAGKKGREAISPEDRFLINTDAFCRYLNSQNIALLSENDINTLLEKTTLMTELKYKNYIAYILGYIASQGGQNLKVTQVKNVIDNILPAIGEKANGIAPPDVVRYARYWAEFL